MFFKKQIRLPAFNMSPSLICHDSPKIANNASTVSYEGLLLLLSIIYC